MNRNTESIVFIHSLNLSLAPWHYVRLLLNLLMNAKRILVKNINVHVLMSNTGIACAITRARGS